MLLNLMLAQAPCVVAYLNTSPDMAFSGASLNYHSIICCPAETRPGEEGEWLCHDRFTSERQWRTI
jgi:hypothetical protein